MVLSLDGLRLLFEDALKQALDRPHTDRDFLSVRLNESIRYALMSGGKRLRPLLVLSMAQAVGNQQSPIASYKKAMPAALAVEFIHTYSLVHDDLPAMDNDDYRRGRLSVHRQYDEGLAILAGDALLADAFFLASSSKQNPLEIVRELSLMAGSRGLVSGQAEDLCAGVKDASQWHAINQAKTARLFESCAVTGAYASSHDKEIYIKARQFGRLFGIAFQMRDDLADGAGLTTAEEARAIKEALRSTIFEVLNIAHNFTNNTNIRSLIDAAFAD